MAAISHLLPTGGCGVDIGAAEGLYSVGMLAATGRRGLVHAFEPNPVNAARLRQVARRRRTLVLHEVALSSQSGTAEFMVPIVNDVAVAGKGSLEDLSGQVAGEFQRFAVPTARLDEVLGGASQIDMIKIDVEGHEDAVLAGAAAVLDKHRPSILIELEHRHRGEDPRPTMDMLVERGLMGWAVFPDGLRPLDEFDLEEHQLRFVDMPAPWAPGYVNDFLFTAEDVQILRASS
jgi:FkbM family methyltransferase